MVQKYQLHFSLILATVDRTEEVDEFFNCLDKQTYRDFDVIVVDQNDDDRLVPIVKAYQKKFPILHLRRVPRGLSRARNFGIKYIHGDIVGFPDDDCIYPPNMLEELSKAFSKHPDIDVIVPSEQASSSLIGKITNFFYSGSPKRVSYLSLPKSIDLFIRTRVISAIGEFDESLGLGSGSPWIACEEMDYGIRIIKAGFKICRLNLPRAIDRGSNSSKKSYLYGISAGYVWKKHRLSLLLGLVRIGVSLFVILEQLLRVRYKRAYYHFCWTIGFIRGWMKKW